MALKIGNNRGSIRTFVSLFCGCGGLDIGFLHAGFRCIAAYDYDAQVIDLRKANLDAPAQMHDLSLELIGSDLEGVDVVVSGSPCQGFSTAGNRKLGDPRNRLLVRSGQIAAQLHPQVFVAENVRGVLSGEHKEYWESLRQILVRDGYRTADLELDAATFGVPQTRKRVIMIAWRTDKELTLDLPVKPKRVLKDALIGLDSLPNHLKKWVPTGSSEEQIAKRIKPGQKVSNVRGGDRAVHTWQIPEVFGDLDRTETNVLECLLRMRRQSRARSNGDADPVSAKRLEKVFGIKTNDLLQSLINKKYVVMKGPDFDLARTFNGKFRRLSLDKPSPTVDTRFGDWRYFLHPNENRGYTVREAARIQGFPDEYVFSGPELIQYRAIGNAVPPAMGQAVATIVHRLIR